MHGFLQDLEVHARVGSVPEHCSPVNCNAMHGGGHPWLAAWREVLTMCMPCLPDADLFGQGLPTSMCCPGAVQVQSYNVPLYMDHSWNSKAAPPRCGRLRGAWGAAVVDL